MKTYETLLEILRDKEARWRDKIQKDPPDLNGAAAILNGQTQFFALDKTSRNSAARCIVVCIGINYSQHSARQPCDFTEYESHSEAKLGSVRRHLRRAFNDHTNYRDEWCQRHHSPSGLELPELGDVGYHLVATNFCPFITTERWLDCEKEKRWQLLKASCDGFQHLDDLHETLRPEDPLWVAHGLRSEVSKMFRQFQRKHKIARWLFTPNLSMWYNYERWRFRVGDDYLMKPLEPDLDF